ncbi:hypothetical protein J6590_076831 [Homalodisca vitripennis]|nr:hypothetical protein J6590_076831 [Homalodisca vitripennis]
MRAAACVQYAACGEKNEPRLLILKGLEKGLRVGDVISGQPDDDKYLSEGPEPCGDIEWKYYQREHSQSGRARVEGDRKTATTARGRVPEQSAGTIMSRDCPRVTHVTSVPPSPGQVFPLPHVPLEGLSSTRRIRGI